MIKTSTWNLIKGISMILGLMCAPWVSFLTSALTGTVTLTAIGYIATTLASLGAGAGGLSLWADKELAHREAAKVKKFAPKTDGSSDATPGN